jgi:hypothetical protein
MGYYDFDLDLRDGKIAEEKLKSILIDPTIEVKYDQMHEKTGNVAIEVECRGKPSGISISKSTWWAFMLKQDRIIMIHRKELVKFLNKNLHRLRVVMGGDDNLARMILVPAFELVILSQPEKTDIDKEIEEFRNKKTQTALNKMI